MNLKQSCFLLQGLPTSKISSCIPMSNFKSTNGELVVWDSYDPLMTRDCYWERYPGSNPKPPATQTTLIDIIDHSLWIQVPPKILCPPKRYPFRAFLADPRACHRDIVDQTPAFRKKHISRVLFFLLPGSSASSVLLAEINLSFRFRGWCSLTLKQVFFAKKYRLKK